MRPTPRPRSRRRCDRCLSRPCPLLRIIAAKWRIAQGGCDIQERRSSIAAVLRGMISLRLTCRFVERNAFRLLADAIAAMGDPLTAAVEARDQTAMIAGMSGATRAHEARPFVEPTGFAQHEAPPRGATSS